jgi:CRP-like cAMP-binding protein
MLLCPNNTLFLWYTLELKSQIEAMVMDELTPHTLIASVPYFAALPSSIQDEIVRAMGRREIPADTLLFLEGDPGAGWYGIAAGNVRIYKVALNGKEQSLHLLQAGHSFNDVAALDGNENPASAWVLTDSVLYHLPSSTLWDLVERHPPFAREVVKFLAGRVRQLVTKVEHHALQGVEARLARLLLEESEQRGSDTILRERWLTQEAIATHLGTVREVVGRGLRHFAAEGIITFDRRTLVILKRDDLEQIAHQ